MGGAVRLPAFPDWRIIWTLPHNRQSLIPLTPTPLFLTQSENGDIHNPRSPNNLGDMHTPLGLMPEYVVMKCDRFNHEFDRITVGNNHRRLVGWFPCEQK